MTQKTRTDGQPRPCERFAASAAILTALSIIGVGFALRFKIAAHDPQSPAIDENEVVEQAVAFMGADLKQHFVKMALSRCTCSLASTE